VLRNKEQYQRVVLVNEYKAMTTVILKFNSLFIFFKISKSRAHQKHRNKLSHYLIFQHGATE